MDVCVCVCGGLPRRHGRAGSARLLPCMLVPIFLSRSSGKESPKPEALRGIHVAGRHVPGEKPSAPAARRQQTADSGQQNWASEG